MARSKTLLQLRTTCRNRFEIPGDENGGYVSDSDLNGWINESIANLQAFIISLDEDYYLSSTSVSILSGTSQYALPADFYKPKGIDYTEGGALCSIPKFGWSDRNAISTSNLASTRYRVQGSNLMFVPEPTFNKDVTFWYIPAPQLLSSDTDVFDGQAGWEEWVVLDVGIKFRSLEQEDAKLELTQKASIERKITSQITPRDTDAPEEMYPNTSDSWDSLTGGW